MIGISIYILLSNGEMKVILLSLFIKYTCDGHKFEMYLIICIIML